MRSRNIQDNLKIPKDWTFKSDKVAKNFDAHVREQLPWYDLATRAVALLARHYVPRNGLVYDVGASTGNIGNAMRPVIEQRGAILHAIEESNEMAKLYVGPPQLFIEDALLFDFQPFDFAVCFLVLMFMPITERAAFVRRLYARAKPGGAVVIVDKVNTPPGYVGTVLRRMAMQWKLDTGTLPEDIIKKELSLAGYQRPIGSGMLPKESKQFFQFGEFVGWVIEKPE